MLERLRTTFSQHVIISVRPQPPMSLPPELLEYAFEFVDELPPLFLVSQQFYSIAKQRCYRHLRFTSKQRLTSFVEQFQDGAPPLVLHTLELDIPNSGQHNGPGVFEQLHSLFCCMRNGLLKEEEDAPPSESRFGLAGFIVDCIRICMNSHFDDPDNDYIPMAFIGVSYVFVCPTSLILTRDSPKAFIWTGRDPPSHFSIAIVPTALKELLSFLPFFTHLTHLELSHVNFLEPSPLPQFPQLAKIHSLPIIPSLRTLKLSCAIHVNPKSIVRLIGCRGSCCPHKPSKPTY